MPFPGGAQLRDHGRRSAASLGSWPACARDDVKANVAVDNGTIDLAELATAVEDARIAQGLTRADVARRVGVAASTIKRLATAADAEADGVLALIGWLEVPPEHFVAESTVAGELLPMSGNGLIRVDMDRVAALPSWTVPGRPGSRTSIQHLVAAAQSARATVASLTRWSPV